MFQWFSLFASLWIISYCYDFKLIDYLSYCIQYAVNPIQQILLNFRCIFSKSFICFYKNIISYTSMIFKSLSIFIIFIKNFKSFSADPNIFVMPGSFQLMQLSSGYGYNLLLLHLSHNFFWMKGTVNDILLSVWILMSAIIELKFVFTRLLYFLQIKMILSRFIIKPSCSGIKQYLL